ncbi:MAG: 16S rRNA (guanine(966)-N(2))-methyltransferase RsmD [Campylobacterales bacterium]|nr:16S rRNA (guanine(966)-N(2))-methyltransferase RsmD [Campylobacterales bacterium]
MKNERVKTFKTPIIGGKFKGRNIEIPDIGTTRSSKSILRESLFNTLQFDIIDKNFVEVFAGSGSIGIEAISREANHAYFIEKNKTAYNQLLANIRTLGVHNTTTLLGDSFEKFDTIHSQLKSQGIKTYFYFDPPFSIREGMEDIYDKTIALIASIDPSICEMVIVEHISSLDMPETIAQLQLTKRKKFGKSSLSYYQPQ